MPAETLTLPPQSEALPMLNENFDAWKQNIDRLANDLPELAGSKEMPDWWYEGQQNLREITFALKAKGGEQGDVSRFYELFSQQSELTNQVMGSEPYGHPFTQVTDRLGAEVVSAELMAENSDGPLHTALLEDLEQAVEKKDIVNTELELLKTAFKTETVTDLLGVGGDEYSNKLRKLLHDENTIKWMRHNDEVRPKGESTWKETQKHMHDWASKAIAAAAGIGKEEAANYTFSATRNHEDKHIVQILDIFDHFGADRIRQITQATGIQGLEAYTVPQLERMEKMVTDPEGFANELSNHDVTVLLVNRVGDHNGVMRGAADLYDDNNTTLFFEISRMSDIYRRMRTLNKAGIKPSTMVLAAHSGPGQFMVSDDRDPQLRKRDIASVAGSKLVEIANKDPEMLEPGEKAYSMRGMKGMVRLVDEFMQPSRGLDDLMSLCNRAGV
jgi:hypothetical protein